MSFFVVCSTTVYIIWLLSNKKDFCLVIIIIVSVYSIGLKLQDYWENRPCL